MSEALLLLPDFLLIALGTLLARFTPISGSLWDGVERLVYWVLFPALLFGAIVRTPSSLGSAAPLVLGAAAMMSLGIAAALALRWTKVDLHLHASGAQIAFRFNSYMAFALAERMVGAAGTGSMALIAAFCVPLANLAAVWALARQGGHGYLRELLRNPLIWATVGGLTFNLLGWQLDSLTQTTVSRLGAAALPLGLMAVGAGLKLGALNLAPGLSAALLGIRHALLPAVGLLWALHSGLAPEQQAVLMVFVVLPTASSAYVLATRMGGHGPYTAGLITLSTLLSLVTMPLWLGLWRVLAAG